MRISDWSSDVCSSDLSEREAAFSVHLLGKTALDLGLKGVTVGHVERRIEQLVGRGQLIAGEARIGDTRPRMVTTPEADRKSVVSGKGVSVRVDLGGLRLIKKNK